MDKNKFDSRRKRGYTEDSDLLEYQELGFDELIVLLKDKESHKRTIAINILADKYYDKYEAELSDIFIDFLKSEKALYTRIEAQKALAKGNDITIIKLCNNVNKIANKQHVKLPDKITKKKTYPIARDIPTRILAQMGIPALEHIKMTISLRDKDVIKELLDAVGYILYHCDDIIDYDDYLISLFHKYSDEEVIIWKLIRAMSGTKSTKLKSFLLSYQTENQILKQEIMRTITFIDREK